MTAVETAFNWSELKDIVNPDDPAWSGGKIVVGVFFSVLTEQYKDMMDSVHCTREAAKEGKRLVSGDPVPYPSVFPNALIVWNLTTAEAHRHRISIGRESWDWLNSDKIHIEACDRCTNPVLPLDLEVEIPPKLPWLPMDVTKEFRRCHRLFVEDDPAFANLANMLVRDALTRCPMASVSFWPSRAVSAYVDTLDAAAMSKNLSRDTNFDAASAVPVPDDVFTHLREHSHFFEAPSFEPHSSREAMNIGVLPPPSVVTDMLGALVNLGSLRNY